jgi:intermediate peptidase
MKTTVHGYSELIFLRFALEGDNITINGLYTDAANEIAREAAYKIYLNPSEEQETTLEKLLRARHHLAQLCGFPSYPHRCFAYFKFRSSENVQLSY